MSPFIAGTSGLYQMNRPTRRSSRRPARNSSLRWNDSVAGDSFNLSAIAPGVMPSRACSTSSRKMARRVSCAKAASCVTASVDAAAVGCVSVSTIIPILSKRTPRVKRLGTYRRKPIPQRVARVALMRRKIARGWPRERYGLRRECGGMRRAIPSLSPWGYRRKTDEWWRRRGSNPRPSHCERDALPAELRPRNCALYRRRRPGQSRRPRSRLAVMPGRSSSPLSPDSAPSGRARARAVQVLM